MIEIVEGFPANVIAVRASGELTHEDYEKVLIPAVEAGLARRDKVRIYYELGPQFSRMKAGAAWDDLKLGLAHYLRWERVAVVTDHDWIRHAVGAFRFLVAGEVKTFRMCEAREARDWITGPVERTRIRLS